MENVKNFDENGYDTKYSGGFSNVQRSHQEYLLVRNQMLGNLFGIAEVVDDNTEYALNDEALNAKENTKDKEVYNIEDYSQEDFTQEDTIKDTSVQGDTIQVTSVINEDLPTENIDTYEEQQISLENKISEIKKELLSAEICSKLGVERKAEDTSNSKLTEKSVLDNEDNSLKKEEQEETEISPKVVEKEDIGEDAQKVVKKDITEDVQEDNDKDRKDTLEEKTKKAVNNKLVQAISDGLSANNNISEIAVIESVLSRGSIDVNQRFEILAQLTADKNLNTTDRVVLVAEINKFANLTRADKLVILTNILESGILSTPNACRYVKNKIALLRKAIDSKLVMTYNFEAEKARRKQSALEFKNNQSNTSYKKNVDEEKSLEQLQKKLNDNQAILNSVADILFDYAITAEEKLKAINNAISNVVTKEKTYTQIMVSSRDYFKFGAGVMCNSDDLQFILPSGYKLDSRFSGGYLLAYSTDVTDISNKEYLYQSPLVVYVEKSKVFAGYDLLQFFNSNIEECNKNNLVYRQLVIGKCPAVVKYKKGNNEVSASVYNKKKSHVYTFKIQFNIPTVNMQSVVKRIFSSIVFKEGE